MVTIYDIAQRSGVSAMTVSRVINNTGRISDKTRAKVKKVMEEMHYVPNQMARSLVLQHTRLLFLLIADITNPFYTTLSRGAEDAATKNGYKLLFGNSDENLEKESDYIHTILTTRVDGVMMAPTGDPSLPNLESLLQHQTPFVLIDREVPGVECDIVLGDSKEGARQLVDHLVEQGHTRIMMVNGSLSSSSARLRLQGYREALQLNGLSYEPDYLFETSFGPQNDLSAMNAWIDSINPLPTAIIAGNNVIAIELIRLLQQRGLRIPDDISIVCFDDFGPYAEINPFVTVVAQQAYQFGYLGMQMLIDRIQNGSASGPWRKVVLPAELIVRSSVKQLG